MSAALESRYRAALRWYPRRWRAANADAIVGTMLDQAEAEGRSVPARGELRNLRGSGLSTRVERVAPQAVRDRVALVSLLLGASVALVLLVANEWAPLLPRVTTHYPDGSFFVPNPAGGFGPFRSGMVLVYAAWVLGLVATAARQRLVATILLGATVPYSAVLYVLRPQDWAICQPQGTVITIFAGLALLTLLGNARSPLPLTRMLVGFVAAGSVGFLGLLNGGVYLTHGMIYGGFLLFDPRSLAVVLAVLALYAAGRGERAWAIALLVSAVPWLALVVLMAGIGYYSVIVYLAIAVALLAAAAVRLRPSGLSSRSS